MDNFRVTTSQDKPVRFVRRRTRAGTIAPPLLSPSIGKLDPFQTLAVDCSRLQALLCDCKHLLVIKICFRQTYRMCFRHSSGSSRASLQRFGRACIPELQLGFPNRFSRPGSSECRYVLVGIRGSWTQHQSRVSWVSGPGNRICS